MYNANTKVFTPAERANGIATGRSSATYHGRPVFVSWHAPAYPGAPTWRSTLEKPEPESDNPANGKVITPLVPLGWVHPVWENVSLGRLPQIVHTVWPIDVAPEVRYAWGEQQRAQMQFAKTDYAQRTVKAGNAVLALWVGVCRGYVGNLADYPEATVEEELSLTASVSSS